MRGGVWGTVERLWGIWFTVLRVVQNRVFITKRHTTLSQDSGHVVHTLLYTIFLISVLLRVVRCRKRTRAVSGVELAVLLTARGGSRGFFRLPMIAPKPPRVLV